MFKAIRADDLSYVEEKITHDESVCPDFASGFRHAMIMVSQIPYTLCARSRPAKWLEERWQGKGRYICSNCKSIGSAQWHVCPSCSTKEIVTVMMNGGTNS